MPAVKHKDLIEHHNILSIPCSLSINLYEEQRTEIDRVCSYVLNDILDTVEVHFQNQQNSIYLSNIIKKQIKFQISNYCIFPLNFVNPIFFYKNVYVDKARIKLIFNQTLSQSQNITWSEYRKLRISASLKAHKIKTLKNTYEESKNKLALSLINEVEIKSKGACNILYGL